MFMARMIKALGRLFKLPDDTTNAEINVFLKQREEEMNAGVDAVTGAQPAPPPPPPEPVTEPAGEDLKEVSKPTRPPLSVDFKHLTEEDMKATIMIESTGDPKAVSPSGKHHGILQLGAERAGELGVNDPFNPEESIRGYTKHAEEAARILKRKGEKVDGFNTYLLWQQGAGGGPYLLKRRDRKISSLDYKEVSPNSKYNIQRAVKANWPPGLPKKDITVGEWLDAWRKHYNKLKTTTKIDVSSYFA